VKVISFYTDDVYRLRAEGLKKSAEDVGLECVLFERKNLGTWWENCNQKCDVIYEAIQTYKDEPIVWNDSDTRYVQRPVLFDEIGGYDFAAVFLNSNNHPFGGTMWFNGRRALPYVEAWRKNVQRHPRHEDDSINFRVALHRSRPRNTYHLPPAYCWRERDMRSAFPTARPVIIHTTSGTHNYPVTHLGEDEIRRLYA